MGGEHYHDVAADDIANRLGGGDVLSPMEPCSQPLVARICWVRLHAALLFVRSGSDVMYNTLIRPYFQYAKRCKYAYMCIIR
jgi:hypothetical protein